MKTSFWYPLWAKVLFRFDVRDRPLRIARVYSDQTLFDEPTRAVMKVNQKPAALVISNLIPADEGDLSDLKISLICSFSFFSRPLQMQGWFQEVPDKAFLDESNSCRYGYTKKICKTEMKDYKN